MGKIAIALDGPAGSGKSTVAKKVAERFAYTYVDTGAMYRAVTLKALERKADLSDGARLTALAEATRISLRYDCGRNDSNLTVIMDGRDVSETIRGLEVTNQVSVVAAVPGVRAAMVRLQRALADKGGIVMDGRDIGTRVLPRAELKVFLTASAEERSRRRWLELAAKGINVGQAELLEQIKQRDYLDSHRETDPLRRAEDAVGLDTTNLTIAAVVDYIVELAVARGATR